MLFLRCGSSNPKWGILAEEKSRVFCGLLLKWFSLFKHKYSHSHHTDKNKHGLSSESTGGRKKFLDNVALVLQVFAVVYLCEIFSFQLRFMCLQSVFKTLSTTILLCSWTHSISVKSGIFIYEPSKILSGCFLLSSCCLYLVPFMWLSRVKHKLLAIVTCQGKRKLSFSLCCVYVCQTESEIFATVYISTSASVCLAVFW